MTRKQVVFEAIEKRYVCCVCGDVEFGLSLEPKDESKDVSTTAEQLPDGWWVIQCDSGGKWAEFTGLDYVCSVECAKEHEGEKT